MIISIVAGVIELGVLGGGYEALKFTTHANKFKSCNNVFNTCQEKF